MSRVGRLPIILPEGTLVNIDSNNFITVQGKKGKLEKQMSSDIIIRQEESQIFVERKMRQKNKNNYMV